MRRRRAGLGQRGARGVGPVLLELLAGAHGERAAQVEAEVVPDRVGRGAAASRRAALEVFGREVAATAPQPIGVGDDHLAVVPQVGAAAQDGAKGRHELHRLDARGAHAPHVDAAGEPGADAVDEQAHAHALLGLGAQGGGDLFAEPVARQDEGADVERLRGAGDDFEQAHGAPRCHRRERAAPRRARRAPGPSIGRGGAPTSRRPRPGRRAGRAAVSPAAGRRACAACGCRTSGTPGSRRRAARPARRPRRSPPTGRAAAARPAKRRRRRSGRTRRPCRAASARGAR